jgi:hypothetical protein
MGRILFWAKKNAKDMSRSLFDWLKNLRVGLFFFGKGRWTGTAGKDEMALQMHNPTKEATIIFRKN